MQTIGSRKLVFVSSVFSRTNVFTLVFFSLLISSLDTVQSYYMQKVLINPFSEANLLPARFYSFGALGYVAYLPIEFLVTLGVFSSMWAFSHYILWYYSRFIKKREMP
jgi:hypothetical protein